MKSKSFDLNQTSALNVKHKKILDFIGLYRTAEETNKIIGEDTISDNNFLTESPKSKVENFKNVRHSNKNSKKKIVSAEISQINIKGSSLSEGCSTPANDSKITSMLNQSAKNSDPSFKVKPIIKIRTSASEKAVDDHDIENEMKNRSKKRNKSVSFMLEDNEEITVKKAKSDHNKKSDVKINKTKIFTKSKKDQSSGKENQNDLNQNAENAMKSKAKSKTVNKIYGDLPVDSNATNKITTKKYKIDFCKVFENLYSLQSNPANKASLSSQVNSNNKQTVETKPKKNKNKKHLSKTLLEEGEPATKSRKKDVKPDIIAEDLKNLIIGDNAHTLTNLLDEMTVVDKNKHKKVKSKSEKPESTSTTNDKIVTEVEKEKTKWKRRKWNKDKRGELETDTINTSVIVENLPISLMLTYKKVLADHFEKCGLIKKIGVAEVYPTDESKPVFTTTINFDSDGAATQALEENDSLVEGNRIKVKRPLPATQTTLVLRTYAELNEQIVISLFTGVGKIRKIRHLVKGKKALCSAFIEFDGPETVERAIKKAENEKIAGKRVHVAKYEVRILKN